MKRALIALVPVLAILGCASVDDVETTRGEVDSLDEGDRLVTIDGVRYEIDEDVSIANLDEGDEVIVTYEDGDTYDVITDIEVTED